MPLLRAPFVQVYTSLCMSDDGRTVFLCETKGSVTRYSYGGDGKTLTFESVVTRFTLEALHCSCSADGSVVAACGPGADLRIVHVPTNACVRVPGLKCDIKAVALTRAGDMLATVDCDGTIRVYDVLADERQGGKVTGVKSAHLAMNRLPRDREGLAKSLLPARLAWSRAGDLLAVPGAKEVRVWSRAEGFKPVMSLPSSKAEAGHEAQVTVLGFSPNSLYLATAGLDQVVIVWDLTVREIVASFSAAAAVMSLSWLATPGANRIAITTNDGSYAVIENPVPADMASPSDGAKPRGSGSAKNPSRGLAVAESGSDSGDGAPTPRAASAPSMKGTPSKQKQAAAGDDSSDDEAATGRRLKKKKASGAAAMVDDQADEADDDDDAEGNKAAKGGNTSSPARSPAKPARKSSNADASPTKGSAAGDDDMGGDDGFIVGDLGGDADADGNAGATTGYAPAVALQDPFQPASTPEDDKRRFLAWTLMGSITTRDEQTHNTVEIAFSDTSRHRAVRFTDRYGLSMAALGTAGALFACKSAPGEGTETLPSVLYYRPFATWTHNAHWTFNLPSGEDAQVVAVGHKWAAAATSAHLVRLFRFSGVQEAPMALPGPILSMTGKGPLLGLIYHATASGSDAPTLGYRLLNIEKRELVCEGTLQLRRDVGVGWIGFSSLNQLCLMDSDGCLFALRKSFGWSWTPVLDLRITAEDGTRRAIRWAVGVTADTLMCVVLPGGVDAPTVAPMPVLTSVPLEAPLLAGGDGESTPHEERLVRGVLRHEQRAWCAEAGLSINEDGSGDGAGAGLTDDSHAVLLEETAMDKEVLQLIQAAIRSERVTRALDLTTSLRLPKSWAIAIKIAQHARKPDLAERMHTLKQAKFPPKPVLPVLPAPTPRQQYTPAPAAPPSFVSPSAREARETPAPSHSAAAPSASAGDSVADASTKAPPARPAAAKKKKGRKGADSSASEMRTKKRHDRPQAAAKKRRAREDDAYASDDASASKAEAEAAAAREKHASGDEAAMSSDDDGGSDDAGGAGSPDSVSDAPAARLIGHRGKAAPGKRKKAQAANPFLKKTMMSPAKRESVSVLDSLTDASPSRDKPALSRDTSFSKAARKARRLDLRK